MQATSTYSPRVWGWFGLSPLLVFLITYLVTSIVSGDFYRMPITVAFAVASAFAIAITRGIKLEDRIRQFSRGAADHNILLMIWIFILAGAFATGAKSMGAIDATVNVILSLLPSSFLLPGLFIASCFISLSIGTSVGTVVALVPIALGIGESIGLSAAYIAAVITGGAFFGDNLSFISDTTIAATRTQGCSMQDKFKVNILIVLPAALIALGIYLYQGLELPSATNHQAGDFLLMLPYLLVIICAIAGMNVLLVLLIGILSCGIVGVSTGVLPVWDWVGSLGTGITGMGELIIVTLLAGGMLELIRFNGGINYLLRHLSRGISGKRGAELTIAALVSIANLCTANNTIAILTTGKVSREITEKYGLDPRKTASILDTSSCFIQGLIPYGAQLLLASKLAGVSPIDIIPNLYYPFIMGLCALLSILLRYPRRYSR
ncbi:MAG: Na+/H+ antiporter NhaC family protein [Porphyromonas sp.]